jgi:hypothetical protein
MRWSLALINNVYLGIQIGQKTRYCGYVICHLFILLLSFSDESPKQEIDDRFLKYQGSAMIVVSILSGIVIAYCIGNGTKILNIFNPEVSLRLTLSSSEFGMRILVLSITSLRPILAYFVLAVYISIKSMLQHSIQ